MCSFRCYEDLPTCGEGGIRTHGGSRPTTVFETAPFGRSGTSPVTCQVFPCQVVLGTGTGTLVAGIIAKVGLNFHHRVQFGIGHVCAGPARPAFRSGFAPVSPRHAPGRSAGRCPASSGHIPAGNSARRGRRARRWWPLRRAHRKVSPKIITCFSRSASRRPRVSGACQETIRIVLRGFSILFFRWCRMRPFSAMPEAEMMIIGSLRSFKAFEFFRRAGVNQAVEAQRGAMPVL